MIFLGNHKHILCLKIACLLGNYKHKWCLKVACLLRNYKRIWCLKVAIFCLEIISIDLIMSEVTFLLGNHKH